MLDFITKPIIAGITAIGLMVGGFFGVSPDNQIIKLENQISQYQQQLKELQAQIDGSQNLGSYYSVGGKYYRLWGSGITSSATSLILQSFKSPINDQEFTMANFGSEVGYGVIEADNVSNIEYISFTGITQDSSSDKATLTGVSRGLNFVYPYNSSTTLAKSHAGGSRFIISDPPIHYGEFAAKRNTERIEGDWTFSATNTPQYGSTPTFTSGSNEFATVKKVEETANQGAATISTTTPGIGLIATSEVLKSFSTTTGYASSTPWLLRAFDAATSTDKRGATTTVPLTGANGKLWQGFTDLSEDFTYTGDVYLSASTTIGDANTDSLTVNASSTFKALTTFDATGATTTFNNGTLFNSTSTRFANIPSVNATATDPQHIVNKSYVDIAVLDFVETASIMVANGIESWVDHDLTTSTSATAKYAEIIIYNSTSAAGVRQNGSGNTRTITAAAATQSWIVLLDSSQIVEYYGSAAGDQMYVVGYWQP